MKNILYILLLVPIFLMAAEQQGEYLGSIPSETPAWFKESFLDLIEDVEEAAENDKRVMLYFHQHGCPYCAKLINENFTDEKIKSYVQSHFDGITINMWGDREVVSVGSQTFTEKQFSLALKVQYTPTVIFLNEKGKTILRLNGYYPKDKFRIALKYVGDKLEKEQSFTQFMQSEINSKKAKKLIKSDSLFIQTNDLTAQFFNNQKSTAVIFETENCEACEVMHNKILADKTTRDIVTQLNNVQLNAFSKQTIKTPKGKTKTVAQWADELNLGYYPSIVLFDENGDEVMRIEAFIKTFHFQSVYDYVLEKAYLTEPSFQRYISARGERIRDQGFDTDIWGYDSAYGRSINDK